MLLLLLRRWCEEQDIRCLRARTGTACRRWMGKHFNVDDLHVCAAGAGQQLLPQRCHKAAHVAGRDAGRRWELGSCRREDIAGDNTLCSRAFF